ncbi:MAG TPA: nucleoside hydrolase [Lachnoclostridium sp.]|uniref:nucleoside hydrolase n=1 Tax=Lacrimispora sp. TaxID=2719234 RepID=UPI000EE1887E|nr:nucleoside hydrolase [Lacrimispora sp.]HCD45702.1 nucleoside hydrolase [Lachnoclostridium sp.]
MAKRTFIIDCDTGTDDAIAIIAALYSPEIELAAITSVNGNVSHQHTSQNNLNLMEYLGADIMVARGAEKPLFLRAPHYGNTHGQTGLGDIVLPTATTSDFAKENAIEVIRRKADELKGELELLVIGPMTNIAIALSLYPDIAEKIKHIWFMGGAVKGGNVSTTAEFNIWVDPVAARLVLASGIPCTMVGLDVTELAILNHQDAKILSSMGTKAAVLTADILDYMFRRNENGGEDAMMHDALALAAALCPQCLVYKDYFVDVECMDSYTVGHTAVDLRNTLGRQPNVKVAVDIHVDLFKEWLIGCIGNSRTL